MRASSDVAAEMFDRCYNATMSKPFQFSIGRLLVAVACCGIMCWSLRKMACGSSVAMCGVPVLPAFVACASVGAGIGAIKGGFIRGAVAGAVCFCLWFGALLLSL